MNQDNPFSLENKTILVTGASSGIGQQVAITCSKLGAKVILTARNENRLKETLAQLADMGLKYIVADLSAEDGIDKIVSEVEELDGLVCNAGINKLAPVNHIKESDLESILQVNSIAPAMLVKNLLKKKKIKNGSSIVFTSSVSGNFTSAIAHASYSMAKAAISSYMKVAALELSSRNIRCNAVCPGAIETKMIHDGTLTEEQINEDIKNNYPLGRYGKPEDVANGVVYLLSNASSWVTGTSLVIDGGLTLR